MLLLFLTLFSVLVADPKKLLYYTVANPARGLLNREGKKKKACMYVCMVITHSKSKNKPGKVANPARGQLDRENEHFFVPVRA